MKQQATGVGSTTPQRGARRLTLGLAALMLGGCATSGDPHEGGFINGVVGLSTGGYQQRVDERKSIYRGELATQKELKAEAAELEAERAEVRGELRRANAELAALKRRIAQRRAMLAAQGRASGAARESLQRLDRAEQDADRLTKTMAGIEPGGASAQDLKGQSRTISASLDQIDDLVDSISQGGI